MPDAPDLPEITVGDIDRAPTTPVHLPSDVTVSSEQLRLALSRLGDENAELKEQLDALRKSVRTIETLDSLIKPMANRAFVFMCVYCGVVALLVTFHGFKLRNFNLPDSVLQFLVGSTATTVIGLVGMVLTGIFVGARKNG
ncbi:hypothetical protein [Novosphingobium sp. FSW06-99]|uniref:hypothetical protein n=1 Tax=Novosphingobium sp. FSW06-99 TaxID=1739113 RepID=UPI000AD11C63|nr:hypothetical protein [Novosphingobium sp. FSW06-99]